jgi:hypothetical protein
MRKIAAQAAACLLAAALFTGCSGRQQTVTSSQASSEAMASVPAVSEAASSAPVPSAETVSSAADAAETIPSLTIKIDGKEGSKMEIYVPSSWQDLSGQLDPEGDSDQGYSIEAGSYTEASFVTAAYESKSNSPVTSLDAYYTTLLSGLTGNTDLFSNVQVHSSPEEISLGKDGLKGRKILFTATYKGGANSTDISSAASSAEEAASDTSSAEGQGIAYWLYTAEDENNYYQFNCWTVSANAEAEEPVFDAIVGSFTRLP